LEYFFNQQNVSVSNVKIHQKCPSTGKPTGLIYSQNMSVLMNQCLQISDNLYAESFMKLLVKKKKIKIK